MMMFVRNPRHWCLQRIGAAALAMLLWAGGCSARDAGQATSGITRDGVFFESVGSGPPVVFLHGFSLDRRMWRPQLDALADRYRVIQYDLRGHGQSAPPSGPFAAYDDLAAVLDAAAVPRATLVGHSAGAQIAIDFALAYPNRVDKLVVVSPGLSGYVPREPFTWFQPVADALNTGDVELAVRLWAETPLMTVSDSAVAGTVRNIVTDNAKVWTLRREDRPPEPPAVRRLDELVVPVLVVVGELDLPNIHGVADTLIACVATARKLVIPEARHMVSLSAAEVFNQALLSFLEDEDDRSQRAVSPCAG